MLYSKCIETQIRFTKLASKQFLKLPYAIRAKLADWAELIEGHGIDKARQQPGFHDEPLKGNRSGQRSICLNRVWRVIYEQSAQGQVVLIEVQEITHHDYRTE